MRAQTLLVSLWMGAIVVSIHFYRNLRFPQKTASHVGTLAFRSGRIQYRDALSPAWFDAEAQQSFQEGTTVATGKEARARIALPSGRTLQLDPQSQIALFLDEKSETPQLLVNVLKGGLTVSEPAPRNAAHEKKEHDLVIKAGTSTLKMNKDTGAVVVESSVRQEPRFRVETGRALLLASEGGEPVENGGTDTGGTRLPVVLTPSPEEPTPSPLPEMTALPDAPQVVEAPETMPPSAERPSQVEMDPGWVTESLEKLAAKLSITDPKPEAVLWHPAPLAKGETPPLALRVHVPEEISLEKYEVFLQVDGDDEELRGEAEGEMGTLRFRLTPRALARLAAAKAGNAPEGTLRIKIRAGVRRRQSPGKEFGLSPRSFAFTLRSLESSPETRFELRLGKLPSGRPRDSDWHSSASPDSTENSFCIQTTDKKLLARILACAQPGASLSLKSGGTPSASGPHFISGERYQLSLCGGAWERSDWERLAGFLRSDLVFRGPLKNWMPARNVASRAAGKEPLAEKIFVPKAGALFAIDMRLVRAFPDLSELISDGPRAVFVSPVEILLQSEQASP